MALSERQQKKKAGGNKTGPHGSPWEPMGAHGIPWEPMGSQGGAHGIPGWASGDPWGHGPGPLGTHWPGDPLAKDPGLRGPGASGDPGPMGPRLVTRAGGASLAKDDLPYVFMCFLLFSMGFLLQEMCFLFLILFI